MVERRKWLRQRFGNIDESILGNVDEVKDIAWVPLELSYQVNGKTLTYRDIRDIEESAPRIAEIFQNGAYEMINNSDLEWHQEPEEIVRRTATGDWNFYGCFWNDEMIAAESLFISRGDRTMEWVWGCVDPPYRGMGVWQNIGLYNDRVVKMSGAQVGSVWVVTTHKYSQMSVEKAGYVPMGCFLGKRFYGGADNRYYRHTLIHYVKIYGVALDRLQSWESMELTESAASLVENVKDLWERRKRT